VIDLCSEKDLRRYHRVLFRQKELCIKKTALIWSLAGASYLHKEMTRVVVTWLGIDSDNYICLLSEQKKRFRFPNLANNSYLGP
jgi:hypothetical protein